MVHIFNFLHQQNTIANDFFSLSNTLQTFSSRRCRSLRRFPSSPVPFWFNRYSYLSTFNPIISINFTLSYMPFLSPLLLPKMVEVIAEMMKPKTERPLLVPGHIRSRYWFGGSCVCCRDNDGQYRLKAVIRRRNEWEEETFRRQNFSELCQSHVAFASTSREYNLMVFCSISTSVLLPTERERERGRE